METLYFTSCIILALGSVYMIFAACYDDGVIGKIGLGILLLGSGSVVWKAFESIDCLKVPNSTSLITVGSALFMLRHLYRFWIHKHKEKSDECRPAC